MSTTRVPKPFPWVRVDQCTYVTKNATGADEITVSKDRSSGRWTATTLVRTRQEFESFATAREAMAYYDLKGISPLSPSRRDAA